MDDGELKKQYLLGAAIFSLVVIITMIMKLNSDAEGLKPSTAQTAESGKANVLTAVPSPTNVIQSSLSNSGVTEQTQSPQIVESSMASANTARLDQSTVFDSLPVEMQTQIIDLSGRQPESQELVSFEVAPGIYATPMPKQIQIVPVAVVNEDGTVTTYEF